MAKFGQSFIQSLTQPGYGMFDLGATIGQAPAMAKEKGRREEMMKRLMSGSPMDQAQLLQQEGIRTNDIDLVDKGGQAQAAREKEAARVGALS